MIHELLPGLLAVTDVPKGDHGFFIHLKVLWTDYRYKGVFMKTLPPGTWSILGIGTADKITEDEWAGVEKGINYVVCPACGGDGKETCSNPDHGFIEAMPGEVGRLGCPGCGHDPKHKVNRGKNVCPECGGHGMVVKDLFEEYCRETGYDNEPIEVSKTASGLSLLSAHNLNPSTTILLISKKYIYGK